MKLPCFSLRGENRAHKTHVCPDRALLGLICFTWGGGGMITFMKLAPTVDAKPVCVVVALAHMVDATPVRVVVALARQCYACVCVCVVTALAHRVNFLW